MDEADPGWTCAACTFRHAGIVAELRECTICGTARPTPSARDPAAAAAAQHPESRRSVDAAVPPEPRPPPVEEPRRPPAEDAPPPKRARKVINLCDSEEETEQRLTIDLCDSEEEAEDDAAWGTAARPIDADDDAALARRLQRKLDSEAAAAEPVDFRALDAARRARAALRPRTAEAEDLLHAQRGSLRDAAARSAARLKLRVVAVDHNAASRPGKPQYERFVQAWRRVPDKRLRLVYHATADRNIPSILRNGLDRRRRGTAHGQAGGSGEYFGKDVITSAPYGKGSRKMIVFAILIDRSGITSEDQGHKGEIVVNKKDHQLPLAVVAFDKQPMGPAAMQALMPGNMGGNVRVMVGGPGMMIGGVFGGMFGGTAPAPAPGPEPFSGAGRRLGGESTAPPPPTRERAPPPVSQAAPPPKKRKKCILDTSSDED